MGGVLPPGMFQPHFGSNSAVSPCLAPRLGVCITPLPAPPVRPTAAWAAPRPLPAFLHHPPLLFNGSPMTLPPQNRVRSYLGGEPTVLAQLRHGVPGAARGTAQGCCNAAHRIFRHGHRSAASPLLPRRAADLQTPPQPPFHNLALFSFTHLPNDSLTRGQAGPGSWSWAGCFAQGPCAGADPQAVSQTPLHRWSLSRGVTAVGGPSRRG